MSKKITDAENKEVLKKYQTNMLVNSRMFSAFNLHKDILKALLPEEYYSLKEATDIVKSYIDKYDNE